MSRTDEYATVYFVEIPLVHGIAAPKAVPPADEVTTMQPDDTTQPAKGFPLKRLRFATILAWTILAIITSLWECSDNNRFKASNALTIARASIEKDLAFRRWAAGHGGVYVPVTDKTPPNPWLKVPERDLTTPSGRRLTLINPAYMTRQIFELGQSSVSAQQGHITSLKPIRPENAPDAWEIRALTAFEAGMKESGEFLTLAGKPVYRYMRPLATENACLKCHASQGYREGSVRGGISVVISMIGLEQSTRQSNQTHIAIIITIWLMGLGGIIFSFRKIGVYAAVLKTERDNISSIFDATPMPMLLVDDQINVVRFNSAFREYCIDYDAQPDKRCGTLLKCINAPSDPRGCGKTPSCDSCGLLRALQGTLKSGLNTHGEVAIQREEQDGNPTEAWLLYGLEAVSLDGRNHVLLSFMDITGRKRMEENLAAKEREFRSLAENLPDNIARHDRNCRILYINPALEKTLGMPLEKAVGKIPTELSPAGQYDDYLDRLHTVLATGVDTVMELHFPDGKGGILFHHVRVIAELGYEGAITGTLTIGSDITERKRIDEKLATREREFRALAENAPDAIVRYDRHCCSMYVNPAMERIVGTSSDLMTGKTPSEVFEATPEVALQVQDIIAHVFDQGTGDEIELTWKGSGGITRHFQSRYVPEFDENGDVTSVLSITRDITSLRNTEAQLQQSQKLESIGTLSGGVAHDFNNLLAVIGGYAELLRLSIKQDERSLAYIQEISKTVIRGAELTKSLLVFSGKHEPQKQYDDLNMIVANLQKSMSRLLRSDITLTFGLYDGQLPVFVDRVQIEQVLINLMVNARDSLASDGRIDVVTRLTEVDEEDVTGGVAVPPGSYALVSVSDNGIGMDEKTIARIFEPFFTTKGIGKGTGLGLSMAFGIIGNHSGRITVESTPGKGSVFGIYLPIFTGITPQRQLPETESEGLYGNETVLLVDDEPNILRITSEMLVRYGYSVLIAADGMEALEVFTLHRDEIKVAVIDMIMPRMNGRSAIEQMRKQKPDLPVILVSGYSDIAIKPLDVVFLQKPVHIRTLTAAIRSTLEIKIHPETPVKCE
ncbi:MAG: PAS domain S-box protein [Desulfuromonadaceae bacterium]|nr:PAS domain S-box protein [Desulfuromonadaceae bacterium]MDD5105243.1 PAS domain S-box protein [Desulfuromonadaceae bacterium]